MGEIADYTAEKFEISREEQDKYALESHQKACHAQEKGMFQSEIVPVKMGDDHVFSIDFCAISFYTVLSNPVSSL